MTERLDRDSVVHLAVAGMLAGAESVFCDPSRYEPPISGWKSADVRVLREIELLIRHIFAAHNSVETPRLSISASLVDQNAEALRIEDRRNDSIAALSVLFEDDRAYELFGPEHHGALDRIRLLLNDFPAPSRAA